jgi:hypothetical protein
MDAILFVISIVFFIIGVIIMKKNKFYKYDTNDMLFATKLKVFLSGFLFSLIGLYGIVSEGLKII